MKRSDFDYHLPQQLIAQVPTAVRSDSRLLVFSPDSRQPIDSWFHRLLQHIRRGDVLVFNQTKVMNARLRGRKTSGGGCELLVERILAPDRFLAKTKASKSPKSGTEIVVGNGEICRCLSRSDEFFEWQLLSDQLTVPTLLERSGSLPLPPYIQRPLQSQDSARYQTVYAKTMGSVAAPTAGLHFTQSLLQQLQHAGVNLAWVTLHVGAATFTPMRVETITEHRMHAEWVDVGDDAVSAIYKAQSNGGRVVAVGTTVVRALETAASAGLLKPYQGDTRLFLHPGKTLQVIDGLITNFHLPGSTLLMLVATLIGMDGLQTVYHHAVAGNYRFFSYGDASLLWRNH